MAQLLLPKVSSNVANYCRAQSWLLLRMDGWMDWLILGQHHPYVFSLCELLLGYTLYNWGTVQIVLTYQLLCSDCLKLWYWKNDSMINVYIYKLWYILSHMVANSNQYILSCAWPVVLLFFLFVSTCRMERLERKGL